MKIRTMVWTVLILFLGIKTIAFSKNIEPIVMNLQSPDSKVFVNIKNQKKAFYYSVNVEGKELLSKSEISIFPNAEVKVLGTELKAVKEKWKPVWGQFSEIENVYNELEAD